ncbi:MAG: hypothetical protein SGILL_006936, partial [Bacillariaceae sp.]
TKGDGYKFLCAGAAAANATAKSVATTSSTVQNEDDFSTSHQERLLLQQQQQQRHGDDNHDGNDPHCHIISVGGNDNWKFEQAVRDVLGCTTHTFDCTLPNRMPKRKPKDSRVKFYPHCLDGNSRSDEHGRSYLTYGDALRLANITTPPLYLKIDVEGFEYDIFAQMIQQDNERNTMEQQQQQQQRESSSASLLPQQIQVELHWATRMTGVEWMPRTLSAGELALFGNVMYQGGGYVPIQLDFNPYCIGMNMIYSKYMASSEQTHQTANGSIGKQPWVVGLRQTAMGMEAPTRMQWIKITNRLNNPFDGYIALVDD